MKIIDAHTHWWKDMKFFPPGFQWTIADMGANFMQHPALDPWEVLKSGAIGSENFLPLDPEGKRYIEDQEFCGGIDASVIMPLDWGMMTTYDQTYPQWREDSGYTQDEINKFSCQMAKWYPGKVYSFAGVDPRRRNAVKIFENAVTQYGAIGLKLYPPCGFTADDARCYPLYQKCVELDVPVLIHSGYTCARALHSMTSHPKHIEPVAMHFPDLRIIIAHSGIQTNASTAWWEDAMGIARTKFNVFLDITAWNEKVVGLVQDLPRLLRMIRTQMDIIGAHRVIFGTDLPGFTLPDDRDNSKIFVGMLRDLPNVGKEHGITFSWEETEMLAGRNAQRVMKLPEW